jgi:hypothetical protein
MAAGDVSPSFRPPVLASWEALDLDRPQLVQLLQDAYDDTPRTRARRSAGACTQDRAGSHPQVGAHGTDQLHDERCRSAWRQDPHHFAVRDADHPGRVAGDAEQMLVAVEVAGKDRRLARCGRTANLIRVHVQSSGMAWAGGRPIVPANGRSRSAGSRGNPRHAPGRRCRQSTISWVYQRSKLHQYAQPM